MAEKSQDKLKRCLAVLSSLKKNVDRITGPVPEIYVQEFHAALDELEGIRVDVSQFRIPASEVEPRVTSIGMDGAKRYSEEKYVKQPFLMTKLDSIIEYIATPSADAETGSLATLENIFARFHRVARQLGERHCSRATLDVKDEYDVQDLLHALLRLHFEDIRTEEWTLSYAGGSSKMDFLLKNEQVVVEVKKTREHLRDRDIGQELIVDITQYRQHPDCKTLVCFIYDPEGRLANPTGLETDLAKISTEHLNVSMHLPQINVGPS